MRCEKPVQITPALAAEREALVSGENAKCRDAVLGIEHPEHTGEFRFMNHMGGGSVQVTCPGF